MYLPKRRRKCLTSSRDVVRVVQVFRGICTVRIEFVILICVANWRNCGERRAKFPRRHWKHGNQSQLTNGATKKLTRHSLYRPRLRAIVIRATTTLWRLGSDGCRLIRVSTKSGRKFSTRRKRRVLKVSMAFANLLLNLSKIARWNFHGKTPTRPKISRATCSFGATI